MDKPTEPFAAEILALKEAYDALNREDIPAFMQLFHPDIERIEPADVPEDGIFHGLDALEAHVSFHRKRWAEGGCEPERFIVHGDLIIALVHVHVRLMDETEWREGRVGDVFRFRGGKATLFRTFFDVQQALDWAGVGSA